MYNACALGLFIGLNILSGSWRLSVESAIGFGALFLIPTFWGVWGEGDWKVGIVLASAVGLPWTVFIWSLSIVSTKLTGRLTRTVSLKYMDEQLAVTHPLVTLMIVPTVIALLMFEVMKLLP